MTRPAVAWPTVHWPSVRGRARADTGALLLVTVVVAVVSLLAGAAPALLRATADEAIRAAVRNAGDDAAVVARAPFEYDGVFGGRVRKPALAADADTFRQRIERSLDADLAATLRPPVLLATGPPLDVTDGSLLRTFQFGYLADEHGSYAADRVTWIAGQAPRGSVRGDARVVVPPSAPPWPVQVGVSEGEAAALKLGPGDRIPLKDKNLHLKIVTISGVFRPNDPADPAWRLAPWLLRPVHGASGVGTTRLGGLLSAESLPDAQLAVDQFALGRSVQFEPDPAAFSAGNARALTASLVTLQATFSESYVNDTTPRFVTRLDGVLRTVQMQLNAAAAQSSVLLCGVLAGTVLVLMLAAALLARRRAGSITSARQRGASLPGLAVELLIESSAVALVAAGAGLGVARVLTPGVAWWWAVPVMVATAVAGPAYGVLTAARATSDRRAPANRNARRRLRRTALLRRAAIEVAVLIAAAGAVVALRQRGILPVTAGSTGGALDPFDGPENTSALAASAPALGVLAGALVLLRLLPFALRFALRRALRSNRPLVLLGVAQAAANAARTLPALVMVVAVALTTFTLALGSTAGRGLEDASWRAVGADVRVDAGTASGADVTALARTVSAAPGVDHVVAAQVTDGVRITNESTLVTPRLVVLDAAEYARLLAGTPLPDAPKLAELTARGGGELPALVRSADGGLAPGMRLQLPGQDGQSLQLIAIGTAPAIGDSGDVVYVDSGALRDAGVPVEPNTLWLSGPGAADAVRDAAVVEVTVRAEVAQERRAAPLTAGLLTLTWIAAAVLTALGLLGFVLGAAAGGPQRWATLGRLRTLGLRTRDTRTVAAVELLPPVLLAVLGGPLLGLLLAALTFGSLALRLVVGGDSPPPLTMPWWTLAPLVAILLAAVPVAGAAETILRRRQGLGELLRVGD
jgi:putative ABC transport system permease protein